MRVSQHYKLNRTQAELDFVDVDVYGDTPLYVDPHAIRQLPGDWGHESVAYVQDFFGTVLDAINTGKHRRARALLQGLREPNETHLGLSTGRARGRALGPESAQAVWLALSQSRAARTGLLVDLEDTILMVYGVGADIVSDIATNLIRLPLIKYTQQMCDEYNIPTKPQVWSGPLWDPQEQSWTQGEYTRLPVTKTGRLLLTPKAIVRRKMEYNATEYYGDFIIPFLEQREIAAGSALVRLLKKRRTKWVAKKDLVKKYGADKEAIVTLTLQNPTLLQEYKRAKATRPPRTLGHEALADSTGARLPNYDALLQAVLDIPEGSAGADAYHAAVERLLSALFSDTLAFPKKEFSIHNGLKRIDIFYVNLRQGFFGWVAENYSAAHVIVECKNLTGDPKNPELDQLSGRFGISRGQFGMLLCRGFRDKTRFLDRCRATAQDGRGYIIPIDDGDLAQLTSYHKEGRREETYRFLVERFQYLVT